MHVYGKRANTYTETATIVLYAIFNGKQPNDLGRRLKSAGCRNRERETWLGDEVATSARAIKYIFEHNLVMGCCFLSVAHEDCGSYNYCTGIHWSYRR